MTAGARANGNVSGSFDLVVVPLTRGIPTGRRSIQGTFDLEFHDYTICQLAGAIQSHLNRLGDFLERTKGTHRVRYRGSRRVA